MSTLTTLELPFPPRELSPNSREHWRVKAASTTIYREDCGWEAKAQGISALKPPVVADVEFVVPGQAET